MSHVRINLKRSPFVILIAKWPLEEEKPQSAVDAHNHCKLLAYVWNSIAERWNTMLLRPVGLLPPPNSSTGVPGKNGNPSDLVRHCRGELNIVILVSRLGVSICNCALLLLLCSDLESKVWWCYSSSKAFTSLRAHC